MNKLVPIISLSLLFLSPSFAKNTREEYEDVQKTIHFLKNTLKSASSLQHSHKAPGDFSILSNPNKLSPVSPLLYSQSWDYMVRQAQKVLMESMEYNQKALVYKRQGDLNYKQLERKAFFLVKRSISLTERALGLFTSSLPYREEKKSLTKQNELPALRASFSELAEVAYNNIQKIRKISSKN